MNKILHNKKLIVIILGLVSVLAIVAIGTLIAINSTEKIAEPERKPKPQGTSESTFLYQEIYYNCSRAIDGEWTEAWVGNPGSPGYYFVPANNSDLEKYCRTGSVIEYRAVIDVLKREDVSRTIAKYDTSKAWVKALGHKYINDKDYLKRILPAYSDVKIDCIIVVHSPEGTRFFIENGETHSSHDDHRYLEVSDDEFLTSLNNAAPNDVTSFWLGLH